MRPGVPCPIGSYATDSMIYSQNIVSGAVPNQNPCISLKTTVKGAPDRGGLGRTGSTGIYLRFDFIGKKLNKYANHGII